MMAAVVLTVVAARSAQPAIAMKVTDVLFFAASADPNGSGHGVLRLGRLQSFGFGPHLIPPVVGYPGSQQI